jgi:hypothetical protein
MPFELGKCVILEYIRVAWGFVDVNVMEVMGWVSKRNVWRIDPKCPNGSIARGISTMLRSR